MASDPAPRHNRPDLLESLGEVFAEYGYDGATLARLAGATGLSKASLYHHFPGGKAEMAATLLRQSVAVLEHDAFARLSAEAPPHERLAAFIDGFQSYTRDGDRGCLLAVLAQGSAGRVYGARIADQYEDWRRRLTATFEDAGLKPKRAARAATELLSTLYGSLQLARLTNDPATFARQIRRLKKTLPA
jgi:AcrR family transcriptional regulator